MLDLMYPDVVDDEHEEMQSKVETESMKTPEQLVMQAFGQASHKSQAV